MNLLIKNAEIPKTAEPLDLRITSEGNVYVLDDVTAITKAKLAKAIEIPSNMDESMTGDVEVILHREDIPRLANILELVKDMPMEDDKMPHFWCEDMIKHLYDTLKERDRFVE